MQTGEEIIYVAGNPDLYPIEYYDPESQTYQGAVPEFLARFAQEYGYDLRYLQPGSEDRRVDFAVNRQVDLISGSQTGSRYAHTAGEPLILFAGETQGGETAYALWFTQTAPERFQSELREYASRTSQEEWTGALLQVAGEMPQRAPVGMLWGMGLVSLLLLAALAVSSCRLRRERRRKARTGRADTETGLGTLEALEDVFSRIANDQSRRFYSLICFHLGLDHVGSLWGDECARALLSHGAQALRQAAEPSDALARSGEDLFVLKRSPNQQETVRWAAAALEKIRAGFSGGPALRDVSAGICALETEFLDFARTVFHARQCALGAVETGTGCQLCDAGRLRARRERWQLLKDFETGLKQEEFSFYLQFFVDAGTFQAVGAEALSRWYHPRLGLLNPNRYVPLLEESGRIGELDFYGLEKACAFLEDLERQQIRDFFISCNFARRTLCAPDFAQRCIEVIQRYSFTRKLLILEVTESQQLNGDETAQMLGNIVAMREFGARVIFDDFGVGFSSFHDLQDCPMDGLKLDKELVDNMWTKTGRIILNALVDAGHQIGMTILAEGVETDEQIEALRRLHCDAFQGFRFSVPLPAEVAQKRILEGARLCGTQTNENEHVVL